MLHMAKVSNKELRRLQTVSLSLMSYRGHIPNMDGGHWSSTHQAFSLWGASNQKSITLKTS